MDSQNNLFTYEISPEPILEFQKIKEVDSATKSLLLPLYKSSWDTLICALHEYRSTTKDESEKLAVDDIFNSLKKIGQENMIGKVWGVYAEGYLDRWVERKLEKVKISLEIKLID